MFVVHLVGNGFDISAGLGTSASTIVEEFCRVVDCAENAPQYASDLASTIREQGVERWCDFEIRLGEYSANSFASDDVFSFLHAKASFDRIMRQSLLIREQLIDEMFISDNAGGCVKSLGLLFSHLEAEEINRKQAIQGTAVITGRLDHHVVTLNYLPTIEKICKAVRINQAFANGGRFGGQHVLSSFAYGHSSLKGIPVCGVDSTDQILNEAFRDNPDVVATLVKAEIQRDCGKIEDMTPMNWIKQADVICVHGMSFGLTDGRWWREIARQMTARKHVILIISSHSYSGNYHVPYDRRVARDREVSRFFDAAGLEEDACNVLRNRMFVIPSSKIFTIEKPLEFETISDEDVCEIAHAVFGEGTKY